MSDQSNELAMLKGALKPTVITGVVTTALSLVFAGMPGFFGALLAQCIVVIFFGVTLGVSKISRNLDPMSTMGLAFFSYTTKLIFVWLFLWALSTYIDRETINRTSFGVATILLSLSWLGGEIASFMKLRIHLPLPPKGPTEENQ